jgi:DNA-binding CsgD family transcriptional regulator
LKKFQITSVASMSRGDAERMPQSTEGRVQVPYRDIVALEMAVLDYSEGTHEYWYRLRSDEPWNELGTQRQIIFYGLAPGVHQFQARGRDTYGQIGHSQVLELEIVPPFWMRTWFRLLAAILLLALGIGIHMVRQQNLRQRANELLRLGETRERALEEQLGNQAELAVLTPRQKEILQLIAEGYSTREMADLLDLSVKTIENHRANLMERLEIRDVPGLVRLAIRARHVSPHD